MYQVPVEALGMRHRIGALVTGNAEIAKYPRCMDPSVQFLTGKVAATRGATIHPIVPETPVSLDDDKIGFTLDVAARLDREHSEENDGVIVPITDATQAELADSA